ncbi:MAG: TatD family hydrolase [Phycisphaerae bacterium]|jgi:TatD DNase family protein
MKLIDSHSHLTYEGLSDNLDEILKQCAAVGVSDCITVGTDSDENGKVVELVEQYEHLYGAVGIHPHNASKYKPQDIERLKDFAKHKKIVAIGETGLDFYYNFSQQAEQEQLFIKSLHAASDCKLPAIIHSRNAFERTLEILNDFGSALPKIVFHCFSGDAKQAEILLEKGFYISFTGVITFKNAEPLKQAAKIVPLEKMLIETDCPYLSPEPMRKQKINTPALLIYTAKKIAELKNMPLEEFAEKITGTTKKFFGII